MGNTRSVQQTSRRTTAGSTSGVVTSLTRAHSVPDATQLTAAGTTTSAGGVSLETTGQVQQSPVRPASSANLTTQADNANKLPVDVVVAAASPQTVPATPPQLQQQQQQKHDSETLDAFSRLIDQVVLIWPEFSSLRSVDAPTLDKSTLNTLRDILRRLTEQYTRIRALQDESRDLTSRVQELQQKVDTSQQQLTTRQQETDKLKDVIKSLQKDLHSVSRGDVSPRPGKIELPEVDYEDSRSPPDGSHGSPGASSPRSFDYKLLPGGTENRANGVDMRKIRQLEAALEQQQREYNQLQQQLRMQGSVDSRLARRTRQSTVLVDNYQRLEEEAVGKLFTVVKNNCPLSVTDTRRSQFICDVMQVAYAVSLATRYRFDDVMLCLLFEPTKLSADVTPAEVTSLIAEDKADLRGDNGISKLELFTHSSLSRRVSKVNDVRRDVTRANEDCDWLIEQLDNFIDSRSDVIDLTHLVESVVETLRRSYPDCCQATLVGHTASTLVFNRFISNCCQLAWQLVTSDPPFFLATVSDGSNGKFDVQLHATLMQQQVPQAAIDHYLWPVMFDRRNGQVLHRGRVVLKHSTYM